MASAGYVLFGFNSTATNLAFNSIAEEFSSASESTVSLMASGFFIASAAFLPVGGRLADRVGRRRVFNLGLIGFIVSAVASAAAPTVEILIAARVAQAISGAFVIPSSLAVVLPEFPAARRSSAVATWAAAGPLSAAGSAEYRRAVARCDLVAMGVPLDRAGGCVDVGRIVSDGPGE